MSFPRSYSVNSGGSGNLSGCYFTRLNCTFRRYLTSPLWRGVTRLLNRCPSPWILFYVRRCNFTTKRHTFTLVSTCHFVAIQFFSHCIKKKLRTGLLFNPSDEATNWNCILLRHPTGKATTWNPRHKRVLRPACQRYTMRSFYPKPECNPIFCCMGPCKQLLRIRDWIRGQSRLT